MSVVVVAPPLLRSWLSPFQLFPVLLLFLQTSAAHQQPRISKEKLGEKEGKKKIVKDKAWEEVKRGNHIFGHGPRRRERLPQLAEGEAGKGRGQEEGLSEGQGHGVGWGSDQLGIHLPTPPPPPPLAALEDCGGEGRCVRPRGPCGPSPPPRGGLSRAGGGQTRRRFCGVWPAGLLTCQTNSVMFMMGYFCYCGNLRHPLLDPPTLDRHPVLAGLHPLPRPPHTHTLLAHVLHSSLAYLGALLVYTVHTQFPLSFTVLLPSFGSIGD